MFVGPNFINCDGKEDMTLADLKVNCDETTDEPTSGWYPCIDMVNILNEEGNNTRSVTYVNEASAIFWSDVLQKTVTKGWYDYNDVGEVMEVKYDTEKIDFGTAIQVNIQSDTGAAVMFSGAVKQAPTITDLAGVMAIANCAPKDITLADLKFNCDETTDEPTSGWYPCIDMVNILNEEGNNIRSVTYVNEASAIFWSDVLQKTVTKGWYDYNDVGEVMEVKYDTEPILAGEGIQVNVQSDNGDATVQIDPAL